MLQFPFLVLFDGDLCLESADAVRSAILTADAFGVVREKDESCVFVDQTRFNFICAEQDGKIKRRFISGLRGSIRLKNQLLFPSVVKLPSYVQSLRPLPTRQGDLLF